MEQPHFCRKKRGRIMRLYSFRVALIVIWGIIVMSAATIYISIMWINQFLIRTYDPGVYILMLMLVALNAGFYFCLWKTQMFQRAFYKFRMSADGIKCYDLFKTRIVLPWDEIRTCGVVEYTQYQKRYLYVYFSKINNEPCTAEQQITINKQRIVLEVTNQSLAYLKDYLPEDIYKRIIPAIENKTSCIYRRKARRFSPISSEESAK